MLRFSNHKLKMTNEFVFKWHHYLLILPSSISIFCKTEVRLEAYSTIDFLPFMLKYKTVVGLRSINFFLTSINPLFWSFLMWDDKFPLVRPRAFCIIVKGALPRGKRNIRIESRVGLWRSTSNSKTVWISSFWGSATFNWIVRFRIQLFLCFWTL